jgi:Zn-dependent protease
MDLAELAITPQAPANCRDCHADLPAGALACPQCNTLVYGHHLEQITKAASNLEESKQTNHLAEARELWLSALPWLPRASRQAEWIRQRVLALDTRIHNADPQPLTQSKAQSKWIKRLGPFAPIAVLLAKAKTALLLLFKLKFLLSFAAFFGVYWAIYGLWFGAGFALSILIHELGHVIAVKRLGLKADLPVFLPGFGAFVRWQGFDIGLADRAGIALAGPLAGLLAAAVCMALYVATQRPVFAALAHTGAWLNLLNLIPVWVLDGGQATHALSRLQRGLLLVTCIVFFFMTQQKAFLLVAAGMTYRLFTRDIPAEPSTRTAVFFTILLFALGALLKIVPLQPFER